MYIYVVRKHKCVLCMQWILLLLLLLLLLLCSSSSSKYLYVFGYLRDLYIWVLRCMYVGCTCVGCVIEEGNLPGICVMP